MWIMTARIWVLWERKSKLFWLSLQMNESHFLDSKSNVFREFPIGFPLRFWIAYRWSYVKISFDTFEGTITCHKLTSTFKRNYLYDYFCVTRGTIVVVQLTSPLMLKPPFFQFLWLPLLFLLYNAYWWLIFCKQGNLETLISLGIKQNKI